MRIEKKNVNIVKQESQVFFSCNILVKIVVRKYKPRFVTRSFNPFLTPICPITLLLINPSLQTSEQFTLLTRSEIKQLSTGAKISFDYKIEVGAPSL